jgi:hypothetical protein
VVKRKNYEAPPYTIFSTSFYFVPLRFYIPFSTLISNTLNNLTCSSPRLKEFRNLNKVFLYLYFLIYMVHAIDNVVKKFDLKSQFQFK